MHHIQLRGPHQSHQLSLPSLDDHNLKLHTPTESRTTVSSSSYRSVSITSAPPLGRVKKKCAQHGVKTPLESGKPNMSSLRSYSIKHQAILRMAKSAFVHDCFAAGLFWPHQWSRLKLAYEEKVLEALGQGNALEALPGKSRFLYISKSLILRHRCRRRIDFQYPYQPHCIYFFIL